MGQLEEELTVRTVDEGHNIRKIAFDLQILVDQSHLGVGWFDGGVSFVVWWFS